MYHTDDMTIFIGRPLIMNSEDRDDMKIMQDQWTSGPGGPVE